MLDIRYDEYCAVDPVFYDSPGRIPDEKAGPGGKEFAVSARVPPVGWVRRDEQEWIHLSPARHELPAQGWKVHVSACQENADAVLQEVWEFCTARGIPFKYLAGRHVLFLRNMKYADRSASGKLVTIYAADEPRLERILVELGARLHGQPGPYVLSDLRWGDGPLYVRYGGFAKRYCRSEDGQRLLAIEDADGRLVPDPRVPAFRVPGWVDVPAFLEPAVRQRNSATLEHVPFAPERVLHYSNGGGVYLATDRKTGQRVVLKEARPHAGLAQDGSDAVRRLRHEYEILRRLSGVAGIPAAIDYFTVAGHHFLAEEFVPGRPLTAEVVERNPVQANGSSPDDPRSYARWAVAVLRAVRRVVTAVHERGVVIGDIHLSNIMVDRDGSVALLDFELADDITSSRGRSMGNPGFAAPRHVTGADVDHYSLACLALALFLPLTPVLQYDPGKAAVLADEIRRAFPVEGDLLDRAVRTIERITGHPSRNSPATRRPPTVPDDGDAWQGFRDSAVAAIRTSATPERSDRLFPGDIHQFVVPGGGLTLGYGAAGVLYAMSVAGVVPDADHEQWLVRHALSGRDAAGPGFLDGLHGVAHVLDHLGHTTAAASLVDRLLTVDTSMLGVDLLGGLAGIGLNLAHLHGRTGDRALRDAAESVAAETADRLTAAVRDGRPALTGGLVYETAGPALLFVRMYEHTGDSAYLDVAETVLDHDVREHTTTEDGVLRVRNGQGRRFYLANGLSGAAVVIDRYLRHRENDRLRRASALFVRAAGSAFHANCGLFTGRAGTLLLLGRTTGTDAAERASVLREQVRLLRLHAVTYRDEVAFYGDNLVRLSMDLATGTAGVLLAVGAALRRIPDALPFLGTALPWPVPVQGPARTGSTRVIEIRKEVNILGSVRPAGHGSG